MSIEEIISKKVKEDREKFSFVNECEKCKTLPEGRFCSRECYYKTVFDYKGSYIKNAPLLAFEYFKIEEDKKEEFLQFLQGLIELYY